MHEGNTRDQPSDTLGSKHTIARSGFIRLRVSLNTTYRKNKQKKNYKNKIFSLFEKKRMTIVRQHNNKEKNNV